jgi:hypothetical protein
LTVGLPLDSEIWLRDWVIVTKCNHCPKKNNCKLVYFDNTYAYDQNSKIQTEETPFTSDGKKDEERNWQLNFY